MLDQILAGEWLRLNFSDHTYLRVIVQIKHLEIIINIVQVEDCKKYFWNEIYINYATRLPVFV